MENKTIIPELVNINGSAVNPDNISLFKSKFRGEIISPLDPGYDQARKIWNASIDKYPGLIAICSGVADVIEAVNFAREYELLVAVKGGGHNVGGRAICDGGIR